VAAAATAGAAGAARVATDKNQGPVVELESMTATDAVRVASADGGVATGRKLLVTGAAAGGYHVELTGDPARVEQSAGNGTLTGPRIEVDPATGVAHVVGPGTLRAVQRDEKNPAAAALADAAAPGAAAAAGRPVEVTWAEGADVRAAENRIDIRGAVSLWLTDADGSVRTANAGRVGIELADKAPAGGANDGAGHDAAADSAKPPPTTGAVATGGPVGADPFKNKELAKVHLYDNAAVNSRLLGPDGAVLRQFHLKSQTITYDARARHLSVPTVGQMLVEVHDAPGAGGDAKQEQADAKQADAKEGPGAVAGGNGTTAFEWHQSMEYDESEGRAVMDGSVIVSHQPDRKGDAPVRLDADTLTANFERQRTAAAAPKAGEGEGSGKLELRNLTARGNIVITREGAELNAWEIRYDPTNEWVIARGTDRNPATFTPPGGSGTVRAGELWLNKETWAVKIRDVNSRVGLPSR
jgi:hypothetical protein